MKPLYLECREYDELPWHLRDKLDKSKVGHGVTIDFLKECLAHNIVLQVYGDDPGGAIDVVSSLIAEAYPDAIITRKAASLMGFCERYDKIVRTYRKVVAPGHITLSAAQEVVLARHSRYGVENPITEELRYALYTHDGAIVRLYHTVMAVHLQRRGELPPGALASAANTPNPF